MTIGILDRKHEWLKDSMDEMGNYIVNLKFDVGPNAIPPHGAIWSWNDNKEVFFSELAGFRNTLTLRGRFVVQNLESRMDQIAWLVQVNQYPPDNVRSNGLLPNCVFFRNFEIRDRLEIDDISEEDTEIVIDEFEFNIVTVFLI